MQAIERIHRQLVLTGTHVQHRVVQAEERIYRQLSLRAEGRIHHQLFTPHHRLLEASNKIELETGFHSQIQNLKQFHQNHVTTHFP